MADTWRQNAIVQAIQIIADKKIAQAGYDRTIKGVINKVIDSATGKYQVRYQDSLFEAYATSSKIIYTKNQQVSVLIPGNDWDRVKTILSGIDNNAINYQQVPVVSDSYNAIGPNGTSLINEIQLSSYIKHEEDGSGDSVVLLNGEGITFNDISDYIKKGNSIAVGMKIRTAFADGQMGGRYALKFNLVFKDSTDKEKQIIKSFEVDSGDVIGDPYQLINSIWVENLITGVEIDNFVRIQSIEAYCHDFPQDKTKTEIKDIFISDVKINGANVLSNQELDGMILHINDSIKGNTLTQGDNGIKQLPLIAEFKVKGKITTQKVVYYWFRQNGMVFRGNEKYSGYAGDGWECLNVKAGESFVPKSGTENTFTFINGTQQDDNPDKNIAAVSQRVTKILCIAVYDNRQWIRGEIEIINMNISNNFYISTRQKFNSKTEDNPVKNIYYLDNGTPTLKCNIQGIDIQSTDTVEYIWSVKPARGRAEQKLVTTDLNNEYAAAAQTWKQVQTKANSMAQESAKEYKKPQNGEYNIAKRNFELVQFVERIKGNEYINFPISSIIDYSIVSCAVKINQQYRGTASLTLYNKPQLQGMYSLNLEHGNQVFQYDGKGNSPTSPQLEKPLQIQPLTFTLIDNEGKQISHQQIKDNGHIKWIIPNKQTLLKSNQEGGDLGSGDLTVLRADLPLAADDYTVYSGLDSFSYSIEDRYDEKNNINYIWLNVKFKDMLLDAYTNFTFPKDGDPGTNGTDFVAKIVPAKTDGSKLQTDRAYVDSKGSKYIDNGDEFDKLIFSLYNNSIEVNNNVNFWTCPPKTSYSNTKSDTNNAKHYVNINSSGVVSKNTITHDINSFLDDAPVDIIRAQQGTGNNPKYFAEYPICYNFINTGNYRFKVKPKTGFKYAVYAEDGTSPNYDNTMPFEIIIQQFLKVEEDNSKQYYVVQDSSNFKYEWYTIGQIELDEKQNINNNISIILSTENNFIQNDSNKAYFKPSNKLDSSNLTNAIVVRIKKDGSYIGYIHIPIYMIINRYGHSAINSWDGNSIQMKEGGDIILAPQVGAGTKNTNNQFTGVLIGDIKAGNKTEQGLFGYNSGERSIFLDAETGNATFGKSDAAQIKITASSGEGTIQSGDYSYNISNHDGKGLKIKFSSTGTGTEKGPYIRYGSNKFSVNSDGSIHAAGSGDIAGWTITDNTLYKSDVGMNSNANNSKMYDTDTNNSLSTTNNGNMAFWAGSGSGNEAKNFYVTHNGYLFSKSGKIAKWNINANRLTDGKVGMGQMEQNDKIPANTFYNQSSQISNGRIWSNNNFVVDNNGKLWANNAQIGPWATTKQRFTNGNVGLGILTFKYGTGNTHYNPFGEPIAARFWGASGELTISDNAVEDKSNTGIGSLNFAVSNQGKLYSKAGKIGGWTITGTQLKGGNTVIDSGGSISNSGGGNGTWAINNNGSASFTNINASGGNIGNYTINNGQLSNGNVTLTAGGTLEATGGHIGAVSIDGSGLHGTGFDITDSYARFTGLVVNSNGVQTNGGGGISSSGGSWGLSSGGGSVGGCPFGNSSTTGKLAVDTLEVGGKEVTWKELGCVSGITLKKAINVFSAPTIQPTYNISGSITVPGYTFIIDGSPYTIPDRTVDCSNLSITTTSSWHDFKAPVQGISFTHYTAQILGASEEETIDSDN